MFMTNRIALTLTLCVFLGLPAWGQVTTAELIGSVTVSIPRSI